MNPSPASRAGARWPDWILIATAAHLAVCAVLWTSAAVNDDVRPLEVYAQSAGVLFLAAMGVIELVLALKTVRFFRPGEPLFRAWIIIAAASALRVAGFVMVLVRWQEPLARVAYAAYGPLQLALLGCALWLVLRLYRKLDFDLRPRFTDALAIGSVAVYAAFLVTVALALAAFGGTRASAGVVLGWATYPLLCAVLFEAVLLRRAAIRMEGGLIGRCWTSYAVAVVLTALGDAGYWLQSYGMLSPLGVSLTWILWYPAAAAYALAPSWQFAAIRYAIARAGSAVPGSLQLK